MKTKRQLHVHRILHGELISVVWRVVVDAWTLRNDSKWIDGRMTSIVVLFYVCHVHCATHPRHLENVFGVIENIWVLP